MPGREVAGFPEECASTHTGAAGRSAERARGAPPWQRSVGRRAPHTLGGGFRIRFVDFSLQSTCSRILPWSHICITSDIEHFSWGHLSPAHVFFAKESIQHFSFKSVFLVYFEF